MGPRDNRVACAHEGQGGGVLPQVCQLLPVVHPEFLRNCLPNALTQKSGRWSWETPEQQAFDALKAPVTSTPGLTFPLDSGHFHLECDASNFATGEVLSQLQANGMFHPVAFMSKGFLDMEWNYQIHDKEMLAIICALEEWHHFLEGTHQSTTLHTELHTSLNISEALPCTLTHCVVDSADCTTTVLPPSSMPPHMLHLVVCLFVYLCHWHTCCLLCLFISSSCCF